MGNEAVDQLTKFNESLAADTPASAGAPRAIDGIILTKFDTIDDKVSLFAMVLTMLLRLALQCPWHTFPGLPFSLSVLAKHI